MRRSESQELIDLYNKKTDNAPDSKVQIFRPDRLIGLGVSANVYSQQFSVETAGQPARFFSFATKILRDPSRPELLRNEAAVLFQLTGDSSTRESGVVKPIAYRFSTSTQVHSLVMSKCEVTLAHVIKKIHELCTTRPKVETRYIDFFFIDLLESLKRALLRARNHQIVFGDIKPENIGVKKDPQTGEIYCAILDLGSAARYSQLSGIHNKILGTPLFMAPEVCSAHGYAYRDQLSSPLSDPHKVDMYSVGMLMLSVCSLVFPRRAEKVFSVLRDDHAGLAAAAFVLRQGIQYEELSQMARSSSGGLIPESVKVHELLRLSLKDCVEKLIECLTETLPEKRLSLDAFCAVVNHLEQKAALLKERHREKILSIGQELISPLKKNKLDDEEWSFFSFEELALSAQRAANPVKACSGFAP